MSTKRRRGIGIRRWLVSALKDYAKSNGVSSHTTAANKILRGKLAPISEYAKYKDGGDKTKRGVSMPEELWLAIKDYGKQRGNGESDAKVMCKILVGKIGPIPQKSIEEGKRLAREREAGRDPIESSKKKGTHSQRIILEEREEQSKRRVRPLSRGVPVSCQTPEKKIDPEDDSYGGVFNF